MAIRVQTQDDVVFGIMVAEVVVTHGRLQKAGAAPIIRPLSSPVTIPAGQRLLLPDGMMDVVYPSGELGNAHIRAVIDDYYVGETFMYDAMVDASTPVSDSGYAQQTYSNWAISEEAD